MSTNRGRHVSLVVVAAAVAAILPAAACATHPPSPGRWAATWGAPPMPPGSAFQPPHTFENQTIRHVVHVSAGGRSVRVRLSNAFGPSGFGAPLLQIGAARIARHDEGPAIVPGSDRRLTFSGKASIAIPSGAVALSDPVDFEVANRDDLVVSLYLPASTGAATYHESSDQTTYISGQGDFTRAVDFPVAETTVSRFFLTVVEVMPRDPVPVVAALGDSTTEGNRSTVDANRRWPDFLSARANSLSSRARLGVVNQGVGCGRMLRDFCGPNGAARFDRDVLALTGVTHVIVALGANDIALPGAFGGLPDQVVTAADVITGLRQLIERGHAQGLKLIGATILPSGLSIFPGYHSPENEAKRQAVNEWIRTSGAFDGVVDFDAAVRDPDHPENMLPVFASDDGVHPSDAGYEAMANAIDLGLFR